MTTYKQLHLKNVVYYKEATLDLDYEGLTVIRGWNKNAKNAVHRANAAGKSLLVSALADLHVGSPPTITIGKRSSKADRILMGKNTEIALTFNKNDIDYKVEKYSKKGSVGYNIYKNGKDLELRTPSIAKKELASILAVDEQEFYTIQYLDSYRPFILQRGSAIQRMDFISSIYSLYAYDDLHAAFHSRIKNLHDDKIRMESIVSQIVDIDKKYKDFDYEDTLRKYKLIKVEVDKLKEKQNTLYELQSRVRIYETYKQDKKLLESLGKKLGTMDVATINKKLNDFKANATLVAKYSQYKQQRKKYKQQQEELKLQLEENIVHKRCKNTDIESLRKIRDKAFSIKHDLTNTTLELEEITKKLLETKVATFDTKEMQELCEQLGTKDLTLVTKKTTRLEVRIKDRRDIRDNLKAHGEKGGHCRECGTIFTGKRLQKLITDNEKQTQKLSAKWEKFLRLQELLEDNEAYQKKMEVHRELSKQKEVLVNRQTKLKARLEKYPDPDNLFSYINLRQGIEQIKPPVYVGKKPDIELEQQRVDTEDDYNKLLQAALTMEKVRDSIEWLENKWGSEIDKKAIKVEQRYKEVQKNLTDLHSKLPELRAELTNYTDNSKRRKSLQEQLDEIKALVRDEPIYQMLADAYSRKGLKSMAIQEFMSIFETKLNTYAPLLFHEKVDFQIDVGPNNFDITVNRYDPKEKWKKTSDVRSLSASESKAFNLLVALSLLIMRPKEKRSNLIILDEMTSNMDAEGKELLIHNFLPVLNTIVPHIVIVTPEFDEYPSSRVFTAVKDGRYSTLVPLGAQQ